MKIYYSTNEGYLIKIELTRLVMIRPLLHCIDSEAPVLKLWGMWSTPSLPLLPGPL